MHKSQFLSLHFLLDKTPEKLFVTYGTPCRASGHPVFYPCYLYGAAPHSGLQVEHQCYLQDTMPCQWSPGDLLRVLRI